MNKAVKCYLRQVKKNLYCPRSLSRVFLCQLEDDILLRCGENIDSYAGIVEQFGKPRDVAMDFSNGLDPKVVCHFTYIRMRFFCYLLAAVTIIAITVIIVSTMDFIKTQQVSIGASNADTFVHPDGEECAYFKVRTNYRGEDVYWEYHSCCGRMHLTIPEGEDDKAKPYATDIYLNNNGVIEHWIFGQEHKAWIRVYEEE